MLYADIETSKRCILYFKLYYVPNIVRILSCRVCRAGYVVHVVAFNVV